MRVTPEHVGLIHFIGIGGIGMSGIAEILHSLGHKVRGSDISENSNTKRLEQLGIPVDIGHRAENTAGASVVVVSSAINSENPEIKAAREKGIPVVMRADMLAELMRLRPAIAISGTHGKTSTTSLLAHVLSEAGEDPTIISGGIINSLNTNAKLGAGEWIVVEADESDGSFSKLPATIAVVTNLDEEHMEHYKTYEYLQQCFRTYLSNLPFYGLGVLCWDHPVVRHMAETITDRRVVTYGLSEGSHIRATNVTYNAAGSSFDLEISGPACALRGAPQTTITGIRLPMIGEHNVQNALAVIAVAFDLGIDIEKIHRALMTFQGVHRRFTRVATIDGVTIIDDYAHHPVEISATLSAARTAANGGRVVAVIQPHRYSRLRSLLPEFSTCFKEADTVLVLPVYAAGESPLPGIDHHVLTNAIIDEGHVHAFAVDDPTTLADVLSSITSSKDMVVCMGAGSITKMAWALPEQWAGSQENNPMHITQGA